MERRNVKGQDIHPCMIHIQTTSKDEGRLSNAEFSIARRVLLENFAMLQTANTWVYKPTEEPSEHPFFPAGTFRRHVPQLHEKRRGRTNRL